MFIDALEIVDGEVIEADVCIAGAGAAGITLARDLGASGLHVCLVESGGMSPEADSQAMYRGTSIGLRYGDLTNCRLRYFGGTTNHWAGWCRPLDPEDFERWSWLSPSGWPIGYDTLRPYYLRAQRTCEVGPLDYDAEALGQRGGRPLLPLDSDRVRSVVYHISPPTRFAETYGDELARSDRIRVVLHANLVGIRLHEDGERVRAFRSSTLDGRELTVRASRYVLALGGIENARILLASDDRRPDGLGNAQGLVGRYFMEHPHLQAAYLLMQRGVDTSFYQGHRVEAFDELTPEGSTVRVLGALALPASVRAGAQLLSMAFTLQPVDLDDVEADRATGEIRPPDLQALVAASPNEVSLFGVYCRAEPSPNRESRVRLGDERDGLGMRRTELDWRLGARDFDNILQSLRRLGAEVGRAGLGRLWISMTEDDALRPGPVNGGCHHMGTTRMSDDAQTGVVDAQCRVHDCANLYLAGSSVFPTSGFANPTLTIVALAHRLADHLKETA